ALNASRTALHPSLKEHSSAASGGLRVRGFQSLLIGGEFALTAMVLISAALLVQSFMRLVGVHPGFEPSHVLAMSLNLPESRYSQVSQMQRFHQSLLRQTASIPGVEGTATIAYGLPLGDGGIRGDFSVEGSRTPSPDFPASKLVVSPD